MKVHSSYKKVASIYNPFKLGKSYAFKFKCRLLRGKQDIRKNYVKIAFFEGEEGLRG